MEIKVGQNLNVFVGDNMTTTVGKSIETKAAENMSYKCNWRAEFSTKSGNPKSKLKLHGQYGIKATANIALGDVMLWGRNSVRPNGAKPPNIAQGVR
jgi:hypothetical protein